MYDLLRTGLRLFVRQLPHPRVQPAVMADPFGEAPTPPSLASAGAMARASSQVPAEVLFDDIERDCHGLLHHPCNGADGAGRLHRAEVRTKFQSARVHAPQMTESD